MFAPSPYRKLSRRPVGRSGVLCGLLVAAVALCAAVPAQAQNYPRLRLDTVIPPGGKIGTAVEVVLDGNYLDEVKSLAFSDARLKAELVPPPEPDPKEKNPKKPPLKFKVTIPGNMPVGTYDLRAVGKWGVSNPRAFAVGDLNEVMETEPNNDVPQAQKVDINTTINGTIGGGTDVDYTLFTGKKGQRVVIACDASTIDSRLDPQLEVYTPKGKPLGSNRGYSDRNAVVDCILPEDGDYLIRLSQFAYQGGGPAWFYRLSITTAPWIDAVFPSAVEAGKPASVTLFGRNLPGGKIEPGMHYEGRPLEKAVVQVGPQASKGPGALLDFKGLLLPAAVTLNGFEFRVKNDAGYSNPALITFTDTPVTLDNGKNNSPEQAQKVTLPATLCGILENDGDEDWYVFPAKKGEVLTFDCVSERLGIPVNFYLLLRRLDGMDNPVLTTFSSHPDLPPANQGFTYESNDPKGTYTIPDDGDYQLMVSSLTAVSRSGPRFVYRVTIDQGKPDFRLLLVENENANAGSYTIHQGGAQEMNVYLIRESGFDGEVLLEAEGLPAGVTCPPQVIGRKLNKGVLVVQAAENAKEWSGAIKVKGTAIIDGKPAVRPATAAGVVWPTPNNVPSISRLTRSIYMAVRDKGPFALETEVQEMAIPAGGSAEVKFKIKRYAGDFKAPVQLVRLAAPALTNGQLMAVPNTNIDANKGEAVVKFNVPGNTQPGTYSLVMQGKAKYNVTDPKDDKKKINSDVWEATPPVKFIVYDKIAEVSLANPKLAVQAGEQVEAVVKVNRLFDFKGEYEVTLTVPGGFSGISADKVKIPGNANEAKFIIKTAKNATVKASPDFIVKVTGKVGNLTFTSEAKFELNITKPAEAALPPANRDPVARLDLLPLPTLVGLSRED